MSTTLNPHRHPPDDHFGLCPVCHRTDGHLNIGRSHVYVCHVHKNRWPVGSNLFSDWRKESEETWDRNAELLAGYTEVEPYYYPETVRTRPNNSPGSRAMTSRTVTLPAFYSRAG